MHKPINFQRESDMPSAPVSLGTMLWNKTGTWRYMRPSYENHRPPCNQRCPAGEQIQGYLALAKEGQFAAALQLLREDNPFPGVCGRVCDHPCEVVCNRSGFDHPLAVHLVERFLSDFAAENDLPAAACASQTPLERVAVIGAGPAGLSCAYQLARRGYRVTVFEALAKPGGMLRVGIPNYRLPRDVLDREIAAIAAMGVEIKTGMRAGRDFGLNDLAEYAAIFVATGAHGERSLDIPGEDLAGVLSGLAFLQSVNLGTPIPIGGRVAVIGGGNSAVDVARVALRQGAQVTVLYRRQRAEMPAIDDEIAAAEAEGVDLRCLTVPERVSLQPEGLHLHCLVARPGELDESGRSRPVPIPGSSFTVAVDTVIKAIGEEANLDFLPEGHAGGNVVLGGDAVTPANRHRVSEAIGSGKRAAMLIDSQLRQGQVDDGDSSSPWIVTPERLNYDYFLPATRIVPPALEPAARRTSYHEVNGGIAAGEAAAEAARCFSCGVCTRCDVCWMFCPDIAISRRIDSSGYDINYDYCKGCGICVAECPRAAMTICEETFEVGVGGGAQ